MKDETRVWIAYADENLDVAVLALEHGHLNACLQNVRQAVEKYLKSVIIERDLRFLRTHSIRELAGILAENQITPPVSEDDMDLMDAIYIPSKYPVYSTLPQAAPDRVICDEAVSIAEKTRDFAKSTTKSPDES